jgi:hypothetical protein
MLAALKNVLARPRFKALPPVICWTPPVSTTPSILHLPTHLQDVAMRT